MAAQEQEENHHHRKTHQEEQNQEPEPHFEKLSTSYIGLSFAVFLGLFPTLENKNRSLLIELMRAEEELMQLRARRKEDSKANARVVEIFASHRHAWQQEEKRLLQQIDEGNDEIAYLKARVEEFEREKVDFEANIEDLSREVNERDEMLNFMSRRELEEEGVGEGVRGGEVDVMYGRGDNGFGSEFADSPSRFWSEKPVSWKDNMQYESLESPYQLKHFVARRESPWKVDSDSTGVSSKLKLLEQELLNLERIGKTDLSKVPSQMRKQAKRYQALAGKIDDLCRKMQASDPCEPTLSSEFRTQRQTEFLIEAFRLQQRASEINQKLTALQTESGKGSYNRKEEFEMQVQIATRRSMDSIKNNFKEIQRNLEIWLARIIGDLEGILARDGASRVREYYGSRYPFVR